MRILFTILIVINLSYSNAQQNYRFGFGVSGISIMHYGLKTFDNIDSPQNGHYYKVYNTEKYTIDYEKFTFSKGLNYQFYVNIIANPVYTLKLSSNLFTDNYSEKLTYTLTDVGDGSLVDYGTFTSKYTSQDIPLGYSETLTYNSIKWKGVGYSFDLLFLKQLKYNFKLGGGLFYYYHRRSDFFSAYEGYVPIGFSIGSGGNRYMTKKMGLSFELQKTYKRFNSFLNLSQTIITAKRASKKGGTDFYTDEPIVPISQNLDFRFPLVIKMGISVEFGRLSKTKEPITMGIPPF